MRALLYVNIYYGQVLNSEHRLVYRTIRPANGSEERSLKRQENKANVSVKRRVSTIKKSSRRTLHTWDTVPHGNLCSYVGGQEKKKKKEESTNDTQQMWKSVTGGYKGH